MGLIKKEDQATYAIILSDGSIRIKTDESDPEAKRRDYETSTGETGVKFERVYQSISGKITGIELIDGNFGVNLNISLKDGEDEYKLSVGTNTTFGEDIMKKLPNINLNEEVSFAPYSFTDDKGKNRRGVTVMQNEVKIKNFFVGEDGKELINGMPAPEGDTSKFNSNKWKIYFMLVNEFLQAYIKDNVVPKLVLTGEVVDEVGGEKIDF